MIIGLIYQDNRQWVDKLLGIHDYEVLGDVGVSCAAENEDPVGRFLHLPTLRRSTWFHRKTTA